MFPGIFEQTIALEKCSLKDGNASLQELAYICLVCKYIGAANVFEIGTFDGTTALNVAINLPDRGRVYTLDLPPSMIGSAQYGMDRLNEKYASKPEAQLGWKFKGTPFSTKIVQLLGDSSTFDFSQYVHAMDVVFIDGNHQYEYVMDDSLNALKMVRSGGVVIWHDYPWWQGVVRALEQLREQHELVHVRGTSLVVYRHQSV